LVFSFAEGFSQLSRVFFFQFADRKFQLAVNSALRVKHRKVPADGVTRYIQLIADRFVVVAVDHEFQHFALARR
jgi:hypothetical protein